jgi:hypothetical protein
MLAHVKRRPIITSAMHTDILHDDWKRKRWQSRWMRVASTADAVAEEDRTTLAPGWQLRVVSVLHLETMCLIMDIGQLRIR